MFIDFIKTYWREIIICFLFVISYIFNLIRLYRKPVKVIDSVGTFITSNVCDVINKVEIMADGKKYIDFRGVVTSKLDVAVTLMKEQLRLFIPNADVDLYDYFIRQVIESILSTPHKK